MQEIGVGPPAQDSSPSWIADELNKQLAQTPRHTEARRHSSSLTPLVWVMP